MFEHRNPFSISGLWNKSGPLPLPQLGLKEYHDNTLSPLNEVSLESPVVSDAVLLSPLYSDYDREGKGVEG